MKCRLVVCVVSAVVAFSGAAFGQGGTTSTISGVVVDTAGGVVPGADVQIRHNATGVTQSTVSNAQGAFQFPGLNIGTYTVTVTLQGFKTFIANDVVLTSASPADVRAVLEVGGLEEQIVVSSTSEIVQTQSTVISSTINANQITKLPITSRSAMDFVTLLPGVTTAGGNRQSQINGLPRGLINITLDGVNIQDNTLRSTDGFFAIVSPRLDAIEEVTVTTATQGTDAGQGAVQIKFVTRSGTNDFSGSGYHYFRSDKLNANTWLNNRNGVAKNPLKQNQTGFRVGGPIIIPGLFDGRNKAFFFTNYEEFRQPGATTRNRTVLNVDAQQGIFRYPTTAGVRTVNVLELAAANGQLASIDPTIQGLLGAIRSAVSGGSLQTIDDNLQRFSFNVETRTLNRYPTARVDYNLTERHRLSSALNLQFFNSFPDTLNNRDASFPGFTAQAGQTSKRMGFSNSARSTLTQNIVNEARVGYSGAPVQFFREFNASMVQNQNGFQVNFPAVGSALASANPLNSYTPSSRDANSLLIEDTLTWLRGNHSFSMGGSWTQYDLWLKNQQLFPIITLGVVSGDPAAGLFTTANFPGASPAQLTAAQNLYALLTGRVQQIAADARINESSNQYEYLGQGIQRARMREAGLFLQDSWRVRADLTLNLGVRYELQYPFYPLNDSYSTATVDSFCGRSGASGRTGALELCNLFQPGHTPGQRPQFINFGKGTKAYSTDYDNIAPSVGVAWNLEGMDGAMGRIFGRQEADSVVRAGFTRAFSREGLANFTNRFGSNPGVAISATRSLGNGNLVTDGGALPLLFRDQGRLGAPAFPSTPVYPMSDVVTEDINIMHPQLKVPYGDSWTVGLQRTLGRNMAVEVRYVGTRSKDNWQAINYNEFNIVENGFLNEFRQAQANLQAHVAAGCGTAGNPACSFAYRGPGTGTAPLPVFLAFFNGRPAAQAGDQTLYGGANWTAQTFLNYLAIHNPNPFGFASASTSTTTPGLMGNATLRNNAAAAGLPANFFVMNPDLLGSVNTPPLGGANVTTNLGSSEYNSLQLELRRRLSQGLQFQGSYVFGKMYVSQFETFRRPTFMLRDAANSANDPGDITHVFKLNAVYDLPFGQGRRFAGNVGGALDRIIGGWSVSLVSRVQSGRLVDLGNVRLVGMTEKDVQKMFKLRFDDAGRKVWMLPQDVIDNTIKAFSVSATSPTGYSQLGVPTGRYFAPPNGPDCIEIDFQSDYGECTGVRSLVVSGPMYQQHDITFAKRVNLVGRTNFEFRLELLNAFNRANFLPVGGLRSTQNNNLNNFVADNIDSYEVTALTGTNTSRIIQLVTRINW